MLNESGKKVKRRTFDKYAHAIELYRNSAEPLKSIANRLGLQYNSLSSYVRRNCREAVEAHNQLCITKAKREAKAATRRRQNGDSPPPQCRPGPLRVARRMWLQGPEPQIGR